MKNYLEQFSLKGKVAFVTGGAGLIGGELCRALASAGAKTVILDIEKKKGEALVKEIMKAGYDAVFENFDITKLENLEKNIKALAVKYKGMDVWVNSAYPRTKDWGEPLESLKINSLRENVDMQMNSYALSSTFVAQYMKKKKIKGSIINFSSIYGLQASDFTIYKGTKLSSPMAYSMIKGGIINGSRYLASYFGKDGIRVNCICPGGIFNGQDKTFVRNYENRVPLKRMGKSEDLGGTVIFLAGEAASYITGSTMVVDGGWVIV
ncbi:MAG: SDR family oxidoreductase [Candidatus Omnitrophica bacterium]|nr:SDR family oxidoreductase [Candidatus Omnitrophota bacterium]